MDPFVPAVPPRHAVSFLLLCGSDACAAFEGALRARSYTNPVEQFDSGPALVQRITDMAPGRPAVVLLDTHAPEARAALRSLKETALKHVPVVALSDAAHTPEAYEPFVNAMLPRESWIGEVAEVARALGAFWIALVRVPPVNG